MSLPKVRDTHLSGIFGDFHDVVRARMRELQRNGHSTISEKIRFYEYLLTQVDADKYAEIQARYLDSAVLDLNTDLVKYLDPVTWFESKIESALRLELNKLPPMRILDLGTGPGHFPVVARFYGHTAIGTDLPRRVSNAAGEGHLYTALCGIFNVTRLEHTIRPYEDLLGLGSNYDLVTAFLAAFNAKKNREPWGEGEWKFFFKSLKRHILSDNGALFMSLDNKKLDETIWRYLAAQAVWSVDFTKNIFIKDFSAFAPDHV